MVKMTKEADVKAQVKRILNKHKWFWWMPANNGYGISGTADFLALRAGVFLAVETKFGSNKPTAMQKAYLQSVTAEGGFGFVVTDKSLERFVAWMEAFDRSAKAFEAGTKPLDEDGALMLDCISTMTEAIV